MSPGIISLTQSDFELYPQRYDSWYDSPSGKILFKNELKALQLLKQNLPNPKLEIGVGSGRFARKLKIKYGVDPASGLLQIAKRRNIKVLQAKGETLPFKDKSFGTIYLILTFCFAEKPESILKEAYRVLKPKGRLILAEVEKNSSWGRFYRKKKKAGDLFFSEMKFHSLNQIRRLLKKTGFKIIDSSSTLVYDPLQSALPEKPSSQIAKNRSFVCLACHKV